MRLTYTTVAVAIVGLAAVVVIGVTIILAIGRDPGVLLTCAALLIPIMVTNVLHGRKLDQLKTDSEHIKTSLNGKLHEPLSAILEAVKSGHPSTGIQKLVRECISCYHAEYITIWEANNNRCPACGHPQKEMESTL